MGSAGTTWWQHMDREVTEHVCPSSMSHSPLQAPLLIGNPNNANAKKSKLVNQEKVHPRLEEQLQPNVSLWAHESPSSRW